MPDRLQVDEPITTTPTIGFNVETMQYKNIKFQVWDLGGQTSIRPYWRCYYPNTDAIIFVVDSADTDRLKTARTELMGMLEEEELAGATLLIFANKQDLLNAQSATKVRPRERARHTTPVSLPLCCPWPNVHHRSRRSSGCVSRCSVSGSATKRRARPSVRLRASTSHRLRHSP